MTEWRYIRQWDTPVPSAYGLAVDEALSHSIAEAGSVPTLHLYTFKPSILVGKYQDIKAVVRFDRCRTLGIEYNRRPTGGGTVIMNEKVVALGFAIPLTHPRMSGGIQGIFNFMSGVITAALHTLGVVADFMPKNDIVVRGKKIAGIGATTEVEGALLFHCSLLVDFDIALMLDIMHVPTEKLSDKGYSCFSERLTTVQRELGREIEMGTAMNALRGAFETEFGVQFVENRLTESEKAKVRELVEKRYANDSWIFSDRHPRSKMGQALKKTPGGLLRIYLALAGNSIENIIITGDFFSSTEAINRIESALRWSPANREDIAMTLAEVWQGDPVYGVDVQALTDVIMKAKDSYQSLSSGSAETIPA